MGTGASRYMLAKVQKGKNIDTNNFLKKLKALWKIKNLRRLRNMKNYPQIYKGKYRTTVRLTENEYEKISLMAIEQRKSVPRIFLDLLNQSIPQNILMSTENAKKLTTELNRIGNNINQIARKVNTGEVVLSQSFDDAKDILNLIYKQIGRFSGLR